MTLVNDSVRSTPTRSLQFVAAIPKNNKHAIGGGGQKRELGILKGPTPFRRSHLVSGWSTGGARCGYNSDRAARSHRYYIMIIQHDAYIIIYNDVLAVASRTAAICSVR